MEKKWWIVKEYLHPRKFHANTVDKDKHTIKYIAFPTLTTYKVALISEPTKKCIEIEVAFSKEVTKSTPLVTICKISPKYFNIGDMATFFTPIPPIL